MISTYASRVKFHKSSFWVLILAAGGPYWVSISQKMVPYWQACIICGNLAAWLPGTFFPQALLSPKTQKMPGELTTEKNVKCLGKCGSKWHFLPGTFFENIKCAWEHADAKNTSSPGTFYGHFESAWDSADVKKFFCQAILLKIFKAPGIVWMQQTLFSRHFFMEILKVPGIVQMQRTLLFQALLMEKVLWFAFVNKFCQIGHNLRIFVAFWWNIVIYALCRILVKCRDLRIFPGKKFRLPGTKNYYAALGLRTI